MECTYLCYFTGSSDKLTSEQNVLLEYYIINSNISEVIILSDT